MMITTGFIALCLCVLAHAQADMSVYGCSGRSFTGHCETFTCPYQACCQLPGFFQTSLVSVRSSGSYSFRLFTDEGCKYHCNDNDNRSRLVDAQGWNNIGAAAYACVDGPF
ncbi:hypothetical protein O9K51_09711 [Purpureocillium lavendulum]|uniref:Uncharacterized protein n=1 Tax=Purpureocillium lavendulum TaxID=1247861 RepID=A0AB34FFS9_9HYPO|nr:hypothetical protein O9K51_09711 [Purpureocillium lavendulum]